MNKEIRWKQRFQNLEKAFKSLSKAKDQETLNELERTGLILTFNFTFELSWKTLKDFLESKGITEKFPRDIIKMSFQNQLIEDGHIWLEMLDKRNEIMHIYDERSAKKLEDMIKDKFYSHIANLVTTLREEIDENH